MTDNERVQRLLRTARVDLERALRSGLEDLGPEDLAALDERLPDADPGEQDALRVLSAFGWAAMEDPERPVDDLIASILNAAWLTEAGVRLYRVSLKPGQPVTDAHRRLLVSDTIERIPSHGSTEVWCGWIDVIRGIHVAFSAVEGTLRSRLADSEELSLFSSLARAIEARAARGQTVAGLWDRLEAVGARPNVDFLAAAEEVGQLSEEERLVLAELLFAHAEMLADGAGQRQARAALGELVAGSGLSLGPATLSAVVALDGAPRDPLAGLVAMEDAGLGLGGVLAGLGALAERVGGSVETTVERRSARLLALRERLGVATVPAMPATLPMSELEAAERDDTIELPVLVADAPAQEPPLPEDEPTRAAALFFTADEAGCGGADAELSIDALEHTQPSMPSIVVPTVAEPPAAPAEEPSFWATASVVPEELTTGSAEPSVAALLPRSPVHYLDDADISVVRERELEEQLLASDEARGEVRAVAARMEIELEQARVSLRATQREVEALRRERQVLLQRVDGALHILSGSREKLGVLSLQDEGPAPLPDGVPGPANPTSLTRFAVGTAIALMVAAILVVAYLPSRRTIAQGASPAASAPARKAPEGARMLAFTGAAALEVGGARPASEEEPAEPPEQAAAQLQPTPEDLAPLAATLAPPEGFEATLMLTRRSKAFVHGDRRTRAVVDLPAGERIVGTCFAAQSTPEAVGSPVYPGYEAVRIPCAGMLRETCDALGCDDVVDACDVAVSVVVPCGTDPAPMAGGGPAAASAPGSAPSLALGPRSKVYSRQARDAVDVTALPGGEELLGECLLSASTRSRAGARVFPGYEPVTLRCRGSGERVCEALGCFSPDGVCEVLASNVHGCSP